MTLLENLPVGLSTLIAAVAITWTAGTGIAIWANEMDNDIELLKTEQKEETEARKELRESTKALSTSIIDLTHTIDLLQQRIELERERKEEVE